MPRTAAPNGWYYRHEGERLGPVSTTQLKDLLATGQLRPRQAVWQEENKSLWFVPAATAAFDPCDDSARPPFPTPMS